MKLLVYTLLSTILVSTCLSTSEYDNCVEMSQRNPGLNIDCSFLVSRPKGQFLVNAVNKYKESVKKHYNDYMADTHYLNFLGSIAKSMAGASTGKEASSLRFKQRQNFTDLLSPDSQENISRNFMKAISSNKLVESFKEQRAKMKEKEVEKTLKSINDNFHEEECHSDKRVTSLFNFIFAGKRRSY